MFVRLFWKRMYKTLPADVIISRSGNTEDVHIKLVYTFDKGRGVLSYLIL